MTSIVLSYRRADTGQITGRIYDHLARHFGETSVFMDIDAIPAGRDFRDHIHQALEHCDVMLAIIGPHWADGGHPGDRLMDANDWVRIEVETALAKGIPVIPILIDQTRMATPDELPTSMRDIAYRNAARIDSGVDFRAHMDRLIRSVEAIVGGPAKAEAEVAAAGAAAGTTAARATDRTSGVSTLQSWRQQNPYAFIGAIAAGALSAVVLIVGEMNDWEFDRPHLTPEGQLAEAQQRVAAANRVGASERGGASTTSGGAQDPLARDVRDAVNRATAAQAEATDALHNAQRARLDAMDAAAKAQAHGSGYGETDQVDHEGLRYHYTGMMTNGTPNGYGVAQWMGVRPDQHYAGRFISAAISGYGVMSDRDLTFSGSMEGGKPHGQGVVVWRQGTSEPATYEGDVGQGRDGYGVFTFTDGRAYYGQWHNDQRTGYGAIYAKGGGVIEQGRYTNGALDTTQPP